MTGSTWALPQQTAFLSERMHLYQKHQAAQTLGSSFWPLVHSAFFLVWPTQESEIAQEKANKENPSQIRGASKSNLKAASKSKTASGLSVEGTAKKSKERTMYATHEAWVKARKGVRVTLARRVFDRLTLSIVVANQKLVRQQHPNNRRTKAEGRICPCCASRPPKAHGSPNLFDPVLLHPDQASF